MPNTPTVTPPKTPTLAGHPVVILAATPSGGKPLGGDIGRTLSRLADVPPSRLGDAFELHSMFDRAPINNCVIPMDVAQFVAHHTLGKLLNRNVLFIGRAVCMAFNFTPRKPLEWVSGQYQDNPNRPPKHGFSFAVLPDLNSDRDSVWSQWWLEEGSAQAAAEFLTGLVHPNARRATSPKPPELFTPPPVPVGDQ